MSPHKNPIFKSIGLSIGAATLLFSNAGVMAAPYDIAQLDDSTLPPPVVVDDGSSPASPYPTDGTSSGTTPPNISSGTRFSCQSYNGQYTVMYQPETQQNQFFPWATPAAMGGGWSEQRRCNEISRRLESYRPDGLLELTTGVENNYNTVCVRTQRVSGCRIVFTVPPGQDPLLTRDRVFQNLTVADSGQQTDAVYTYRNRGNELDELVNLGRSVLGGSNRSTSKGINLRPFLDQADGGTGTKLRGGVSMRNRTQPKAPNSGNLNPGNFR